MEQKQNQYMYLNNLTYIYQQFSQDILKHGIKPFLRRGSGHPSADEDLHRHESHSGRRAADDGRHSESRDPPGDSNDTGSGRGPWCGGGGGMGWVLSASCHVQVLLVYPSFGVNCVK